MRSSDSNLPPEAIERLAREAEEAAEQARNHLVGVGLMLIGAIIAIVPLVKTGDITVVPAILAGTFLIVAGVLIDPKRFVPIAERGIAKLPGKD